LKVVADPKVADRPEAADACATDALHKGRTFEKEKQRTERVDDRSHRFLLSLQHVSISAACEAARADNNGNPLPLTNSNISVACQQYVRLLRQIIMETLSLCLIMSQVQHKSSFITKMEQLLRTAVL
jgi:hypothetical protein